MIYTHRPCFFLAIGFSVGILAAFIAIPIWIAYIFLMTCFLFAALFFKFPISKVFLLAAVVASGFIYTKNYQSLPADNIGRLFWKESKQVEEIEGVVASEVETRSTRRGVKTTFELEVRKIKKQFGWQRKSGKVLVNVFRRVDLSYGDQLLIKGRLHRPFKIEGSGHFSYADFLQRRGIYWMMSVGRSGEIGRVATNQGNRIQAKALELRVQLKAVLKKYLTPIEAAIMQSFLLGGRSPIPDEIRELFVLTGTAHILAISGQNITVISLVVFLLLRILRIPRAVQLAVTIVFLGGYALLTGLSPSVVRAAIMAIIFWMTFLFEREGESLNSLGLAALAILFMNPFNIFDIGFQLSFTGVFAIIYFYPVIYGWIKSVLPEDMPGFWTALLQALCVSLAAWLGVAGLILYHFEVCTPITIIANLPIIPFMAVLMVLGLGLMACAFLGPGLAVLAAYCVKIFLKSLVLIIFGLSQMPGGYFYAKVSLTVALVYYVFILALFWWAKNYWVRTQNIAPMVADIS